VGFVSKSHFDSEFLLILAGTKIPGQVKNYTSSRRRPRRNHRCADRPRGGLAAQEVIEKMTEPKTAQQKAITIVGWIFALARIAGILKSIPFRTALPLRARATPAL
jgi:hypothetical protein